MIDNTQRSGWLAGVSSTNVLVTSITTDLLMGPWLLFFCMPRHSTEKRPFDDQAGWARLAGFLTESEVAEAIVTCNRHLELPALNRRARDRPHAGTHHLVDLDDRSEFVSAILERPELIAIVAEILGPKFHRSEVAYRSPQPSFGGQQLHADDPPKLTAGPNSVATAIIALTAFTNDNGATRLIPGSHHRPDIQRLSGSLETHPDQILLTGKAGTAFVFSGHVLHSGTPNHSKAERPALHLVWRA